jgi:hypothetical protein
VPAVTTALYLLLGLGLGYLIAATLIFIWEEFY